MRIINRKIFQSAIFQYQMMKAVLALFLFGAANSCFIGNCLGGGRLCNLGGKPTPAPIYQPQPPQVCQQPPQVRPIQPTQTPNNPPITDENSKQVSQLLTLSPAAAQLLFKNPGFSQPPNIDPGFSQPTINNPGFSQLSPTFVQEYPNYPNYPQQPSYPNYPQIPNNPRQRDDYVLSFDWAPRTKGINNIASSQAIVRIGDQKVADLSAADGNQKVRHAEICVDLQNGENSISFEGTGKSDSYGVTVSNVVIRRRDSNQNILVNGDFSSPRLAPGTWQYIRNGIKGWSAYVAEVGDCKIYNNNWKSGQCIEVDSTKNQIYTQKFTVNRC